MFNFDEWAELHLAADFDGEDWEGDWDEIPGDDGWDEHWAMPIITTPVLKPLPWGEGGGIGFFTNEGHEPPF